jgi:large subunit ribosomal protein L31
VKPGVHPDYHPVVYRDRGADFGFLKKYAGHRAPWNEAGDPDT